jgi:eukaryotic-like serine/threonine-protein kinase
MSSGTDNLGCGPRSEPSGEISATEVRAELDRILASDVFSGARRPSDFLRFVVETCLNGGGARIKEFLVGVDVFGRPAQYDPRLDPVVRIEAGRLRTKLVQYYGGPGSDDPIVIDLPKGSYVPGFKRSSAAGLAEGAAAISTALESSDAAVASPARQANTWKMWLVVATAAFLVIMIVAALFDYYPSGKAPLSANDTIVIGEFANATGDPIFDETLKTAVTHSLAQSPLLNILPDSVVASTLKLMTLAPDTRLVPAIARELCLRAGSKAYVTGSIAAQGQKYILSVRALDCQSGEKLAERQVKASAQAGVLDALSGAASELRRKLGESAAAVQRFDVPLSEATTASLQALNAYSLGVRAHRSLVPGASLPYALRAIDLDPHFALAYNAAANDFISLGQVSRAQEFFTKAFQLRQHASERERLKITADYYNSVTGELDQAATVFQQEIETYPRDSSAYANLGIAYARLGEYQKSLEVTRHSLGEPLNYENLGNRLLALGLLDDTRQTLNAMRKQGREDFIAHILEYGLAFQTEDLAAMAGQLEWFAGQPPYTHYGIELESDTEAYFGHLRKARELTMQAVKAAVAAKDNESGAIWEAIAAQREAAYGNQVQARQMAQEAIKLAAISPAAESEAALALALAGDRAHAIVLANGLEDRFPLATQMQALWLAPIKAQIALEKGNAAAALTSLGNASTIEIGAIPFVLNFSCLYPAYVRGQAYLEAGQGGAAAAEFQTILNHKGIVWNCWTGALAQLGLARAEVVESTKLSGTEARAARDRAGAAYDAYFELWKDADPDTPVYRQAKAEFARLR